MNKGHPMKSMIEQLQEAEQKKQLDKKLEDISQVLTERLKKMGVASYEQITPENIVEAISDWMRKEIYKEYPAADPKVVEALLLTYQNFVFDMYKEIDSTPEEAMEELSDRLSQEGKRFGIAIKKTLKMMN